MTYITKADLKVSLEATGTSALDRDLDRAIAAADAAINAITNRRFTYDEETVARYYSPVTDTRCFIDDVYEAGLDQTELDLIAVAVDRAADATFSEAWTLNTDYKLLPLNAVADSKPYTMLVAIKRAFPKGPGSIRVSARFGWPTVPPEVVQAAGMVANRFLVQIRQAPLGIVMAGQDVGVAMRLAQFDPTVMMLLDGVKREVYC